MKIDNDTIEILKNFSLINSQIYVKKGNVIRSMERGKTILAESKLPFTFDVDFAIYDLNKFMTALNLFKEPELTFKEKCVTIHDSNKSLNYFYANVETLDDNTIKALNEIKKTDTLDELDISFETLSNVRNISSVIEYDEFHIQAEGGEISFNCFKKNNPSAGNFKEVVGKTDKTYNISANKIKHRFYKDSYKMIVYDTGITKFVGDKVSYWVPGEFV